MAPVAGEIVERNAMVGAVATAAGEPMFVLIRDGELELRADVAERIMLRLKPGQTVTMRGVGLREPLTGEVRLVRADDRPGHAAGPGAHRHRRRQLGAVRHVLSTPRSSWPSARRLAVPVTAMAAGDDGAAVMRVVDGLVERVPVKTGIRDRGHVEILAGLAAGDLVVTKAGAFVRDGRPDQPGARPRRHELRVDAMNFSAWSIRNPDRAAAGLLPADGAGLAILQRAADHPVSEHRRAAGRGHGHPVGRGPGRDGNAGHQGDRGCRGRASPGSRTSPRP